MTTKVSDVLRAARAKIEKPENWCQGSFRNGHAYCALGAVRESSYGVIRYIEACDVLERLAGPIPKYNDSHTHAEVLSLFDRAIATAELEG